ncbi:flavin reductase family protein [Kamptonema cortianum]|nr:flavin reductase family protein [Geitlerinema splendidum]MDK3155988.1 flavin reductase family protein [Kamptonema cortianum]
MSQDFVTFDVNGLPPGKVYELVSNLVVPRPIAFVSTLDQFGVANLAPFSFFNVGGIAPASLVFCCVNNIDGSMKDTAKNILQTREFVVNLVTRTMADGMNSTSAAVPSHVDEWVRSGFHRVKSSKVQPDRVLESPVQFECSLFELVKHGEGPGASCYVIGEILAIHVSRMAIPGESEQAFAPIARLGGPEYLDLESGEKFRLQRPTIETTDS